MKVCGERNEYSGAQEGKRMWPGGKRTRSGERKLWVGSLGKLFNVSEMPDQKRKD